MPDERVKVLSDAVLRALGAPELWPEILRLTLIDYLCGVILPIADDSQF